MTPATSRATVGSCTTTSPLATFIRDLLDMGHSPLCVDMFITDCMALFTMHVALTGRADIPDIWAHTIASANAFSDDEDEGEGVTYIAAVEIEDEAHGVFESVAADRELPTFGSMLHRLNDAFGLDPGLTFYHGAADGCIAGIVKLPA